MPIVSVRRWLSEEFGSCSPGGRERKNKVLVRGLSSLRLPSHREGFRMWCVCMFRGCTVCLLLRLQISDMCVCTEKL